MSAYFDAFFFGIFPYIALVVLAVGSILRYEREPYTWRSGSSQLLRRRQLVWGSVLFHVGVLIVFLGHFLGLLVPIQLFHLLGIAPPTKQMMAIVVGGVAGVVALAGGLMLLHRRLADARIRRTSSFADIAVLALLDIQLVLGLAGIGVSLEHLDGSMMMNFMAWSQGIFTFDVDAWQYVRNAHWLFKAHLILGLFLFLIFPFTRLVHMLSMPMRYLYRPGYQIVRSKRGRPAGSA